MSKILVVFYSSFGTNHRMAEIARSAAEEAGAEVRFRRCRETAPDDVVEGMDAWKDQLEAMQDIEIASPDDMEWADGYFVSAPVRFGDVASQYRAFVDTLGPKWQSGALANKTFTATTSAQNVYGGQAMALMSLYVNAMHWGCVLVPPGYTDDIKFEDGGCPYGYCTTAGDIDDAGEKSIRFQATRLVEMTDRLTA